MAIADQKNWIGNKIKRGADRYSSNRQNVYFNTDDLDPIERRWYDDFIKKGIDKDRALIIIINTVEGDWSQLSPALKRYAKAIGLKPNA